MRTKPYQTYFEEEVLAANPLQLVRLLYRGALDSIAAARRHLRLGEIRRRSDAISKAMAIVTELSRSLDPRMSGELGVSLAELYGYVQSLLIEANIQQSDPPLAEAETLLATLLEGWACCAGAGHVGEKAAEREPVGCAY
ncbi:MAG TPA: flagellar export chaperone FliS [Bryobacteraceae bacterium]